MAMASGSYLDYRHHPERQFGQLQLLGHRQLSQASTFRCSMSLGAMRPASATGCKTASRTGSRRDGHDGDGGVHAQWRDDDTSLMAVTRNTGATYFIPSENEWYKAAYYNGGDDDAGYWALPDAEQHRSDQHPFDPTGTNNANF